MTGRFEALDAFVPQRRYEFLPFRFERLRNRVLAVNEVGEHLFLSLETFSDFVGHSLSSTSEVYADLKSKHFLYDTDPQTTIELLTTKYRTKKSFLDGFTKLHLFVVSLRCEHSCHYCQVSRVSTDRTQFDMSAATAERALDLVFRSPAKDLKIEFQGGEPLLNFERIVQVVLGAEARAALAERNVQFVVATNLALLDEDMLRFLADHRVALSTSLDGPADLHNVNRPRPGNDSYEAMLRNLTKARAVLGHDRVSAIMTTTRASLARGPDIVQEYARLGFHEIFLRSLSPYGFAIRTARRIGYTVEEFLAFYVETMDQILAINRAGTFFVETYAQILLTKILTPFPSYYVDLQSPSGAGIGAVVYNYDGDVYPSDESRMLTEMGDCSHRLGNVHTDSYQEIFGGKTIRALAEASIIESLPGCSDCALQTYCGGDPTFHYATQHDMVGHRPTSDFHRKNAFIIRHLLERHEDDPSARRIFASWVANKPYRELLREECA
ncbi:MAG: hypothetical protein QOK37_3054 [Thermoanaerobaculia bacterium]|jgi:His-Xaa-Ser system radical SAM maturase HxsB|nr:hypothetical protein [Thermoanaerobaculia bacterium]